MKIKYKLIVLLLCLAFAFNLVACSSSQNDENPKSEDTSTPPKEEETYPSERADYILIFQVYGTGGKTDAAVSHSFIELYNPTDNDISIDGYSLQYAKKEASWNKLDLKGIIKAHSSFLILGKLSDGTGCNLILDESDADMLWDIELDNNNFKVCLLLNTEQLTEVNPFNTDGKGARVDGYVDMFGGADNDMTKTIDGYETEYPYILSKQKSARRLTLVDSDNNAIDFGGVDYRADRITDELKERYRPKNTEYGEWNPVSTVTLSGTAQYVEEIFKENEIIDIRITISSENRAYMKANAIKEEYVSCNINVAGYTYENVGIRPKGNSTLSSLAKTSTERFSFKVKFNEYEKGQKLLGLKKLVLNCGYQDKTFVKEYESYKTMKALGIPTPAYTWARIYLNDEYFGLYFALEDIDETFVERYYGTNIKYTLYKPEGANMSGSNSAGSLKYLGDNISSYSDIFNNTVCTSGDYDSQKSYINMTKVLSSGKNLESVINVDGVLRYAAAMNYLVNLDSYIGAMYHNYYLLEVNGIFTIIPWDFNLSYAGHNVNSASNAVNYPIDKVYTSSNPSDSPLTSKIITTSTKEVYYRYLKFLADYNAVNSTSDIDTVAALIDTALKSDPTKHSTYAEFTKGVSTLKQFIIDRNKSIYAQQNGTQSTTSYGNISTSVNLSDMGTMGAGMGGDKGRPGWN